MMRTAPYWTVVSLLFASLGVLVVRGDKDRVPPSTPLAQFPIAVDGRVAMDVAIPQESLDLLGNGFFLNRIYGAPGIAPDHQADAVDLFIAYFPTQRSGQSIHSPQNCLPGAGWSFVSSGTLQIRGADGRPHEVGDYLISDGVHQAEVLYWYKTESRWIANDWVAKYYLLLDSMLYARTDAALVRINTLVVPGESRDAARQRVVDFAKSITPLLPAYVPD